MNRSAINVASRWMIANIASDDALILLAARILPDLIFGNGKGPIVVIDRDPDLAQQLERAGTGRVAIRIGDREPLACNQAGDIGDIRAVDRPGGALGTDKSQAVAQRTGDGGALDDFVRAASSVAVPASAKIRSQRAPRSIWA